MAVPQSENIEKVKKSNQKEEYRMKCRLNELHKQKQQLLENLQKDQLRMVHQVKANRIRELRQTLRQGLGVEEQVNMMRQRVFPGRSEQPTRRVTEVKGFSKVDVEEEEDDTDVYMDYLRSRSTPNLHILQAKWALRRAEEEEARNHGKPKEEKYDINDDEIFLRYPCEINEKTQGIITLRDWQDFQKQRSRNRYIPDQDRARIRPKTVNLNKTRYPLPKYVTLMQRLGDPKYDEYTDGTMALEMRKFKQKQRERTPVPVGFLPVRKRYIDEFEEFYDNSRSTNVASSAPAMSIHGRAPAQVRIYLPRGQEPKPEDEEHEEHERLHKLRKADQADLYRDSIKHTSSFLGKDPAVQELVPKERLNREETIMLTQLRHVPEFRNSSKMVKSSRGTQYNQPSRLRNSETGSQIRSIMNYVLNKDYSDKSSDSSAPPPPRLCYDSSDSD